MPRLRRRGILAAQGETELIPLFASAFLASALLGGAREWLLSGMLYYPTPGVDVRPEELGIDAEEIFFEAEDGVRLHAYWLPSPGGAPRALLLLHGNAGNASQRLDLAALLQRELDSAVLLLDYRGYGLSEGTPSEAGLAADARAALAHLTRARGLPENRVVLFGQSLGAAVAIDLAQGRPLAGVILESTFDTLADMARTHFGAPAAWLASGLYDSHAKIGALRAPLLYCHGDRDEIVPYASGRRLFAAAPEPKEFLTLSGAQHNDTFAVGGPPYLERIRRFIDRVAAR